MTAHKQTFSFLAAMRFQYSKSKNAVLACCILAGLYVLVLTAGLLLSETWSQWLLPAAFVLQVAIFWLNYRSKQHYLVAEGIRRPAILFAGLGFSPPEELVRRLAVKAGVVSGHRLEAETYYASKSAPGPTRLLEIVEESAYFTSDLACWISGQLWLVRDGAFVLIVLGVFEMIWHGLTGPHGPIAAKALLNFSNLFFFGEITSLANDFRELGRSSECVYLQCATIKRTGATISLMDALYLTDEYNCALSAAPVIPDWVYSRRVDALNASWNARSRI